MKDQKTESLYPRIELLKDVDAIRLLYRYAFGFGIMAGLLAFAYGMYVLGGLHAQCKCEAANIATFLSENLDQGCIDYANRGYVAPSMDEQLGYDNGGNAVVFSYNSSDVDFVLTNITFRGGK